MTWKQIKIFTADGEQSATIEPNPEQTGLVLNSTEEMGEDGFVLYMSYDEARAIGQELIRYADEKQIKRIK